MSALIEQNCSSVRSVLASLNPRSHPHEWTSRQHRSSRSKTLIINLIFFPSGYASNILLWRHWDLSWDCQTSGTAALISMNPNFNDQQKRGLTKNGFWGYDYNWAHRGLMDSGNIHYRLHMDIAQAAKKCLRLQRIGY